jgi:hypothetical protein
MWRQRRGNDKKKKNGKDKVKEKVKRGVPVLYYPAALAGHLHKEC